MPTPKEQLASIYLGRPVREWIVKHRAAGWSYRDMVQQFRADTGERMTVTHETLRAWDPDAP